MSPHQRYAALVARQLDALQQEDLASVAALADEREALVPAIQGLPASGDEVEALREAALLGRELLRGLRERRDGLYGVVHREQSAAPRLAAYARAASVLTPHAVDLSL